MPFPSPLPPPLPPPWPLLLNRLLLCLLGLFCGSALALDELDEVHRLVASGQPAVALQRAEAHLAAHPKDAQMRFARGVLLADSGRPAEAMQAYNALIDDHPELAEPYNNLAALQAAAGDYEQARLALEQAVRAQPAFALAQQNLGDVLAALAARAYARALALEPANAALAGKLAAVKQLVSASTPAALPAR